MRVQPVVVNVPLFERTAHLCDVLGDETYESLARAGAAMTAAAVATYAYDQIDQARAQLQGAD